MCGISGVFRPVELNEKDFKYSEYSLENLKSRGPDNCQSIKITNNLLLNHTRLSIIEPDQRNDQPLFSFSGKYVITFNGEIYNFEDLKKNLIKNADNNQYANQISNSFSDTRILLEHFEKFGIEETMIILNGMYAIALFNKKTNLLYLMRDYYGQKPLFYSHESNLLVFSSLLTDCKDLSRKESSINRISALHGIQFGMSLFPETLFSGIFELQPGHLLTACIHQDFSILKTIVDMRGRISKNFKLQSKNDNFSEIFQRVIKRHLIADCDISLLFSGGIDSSLIAFYLKQNSKGISPNCYTLDFKNQGESQTSYWLAKELGLRHNLIKMNNKEYQDVVENTLYEIDQPAYDPAIFSARYLIKRSKEVNCKVVITGDGSDEVFGGYERHYRRYFSNSYLPKYLSRKISDLMDKINKKIEFYRRINQIAHRFLSNSSAESYLNQLSDNPQIFSYSDYLQILLQDYFTKDSSSNLHADIDQRFFLPNKMLFKSDRASMLESLETRCPFLDMEILSISNKVDKLLPKKILKIDLKQKIRNYQVNRNKEGFSTNFDNLEKVLNVSRFSRTFDEINEIIGLKNLNKKISCKNQKIIISKKYPYGDWNYLALAKWIDLNY